MPARSHLFAALLLLAMALPAQAATGVATKETALQRIQRSVARIDREASTPEGEAAVVKRLAAQLGMPEDSLRARHDAWALGYGEITMVYGFARASRRQSATLSSTSASRTAGSAWRNSTPRTGPVRRSGASTPRG